MRARLVFLWVCIGALLAGTVAIVDIGPTEVLAIASPASQTDTGDTVADMSDVTTRPVTLVTTGCTDYMGNVTECPPVPVEHCVNGVLTTTPSDALPDPITFPGDTATDPDGNPGTLDKDCSFLADPVLVTYCLNGVPTMGTETQAGTNPKPGDTIFGANVGIVGDDCGTIPAARHCVNGVLTITPQTELPANPVYPGDIITGGDIGIVDDDCGFILAAQHCVNGVLTTTPATQVPADAVYPGDAVFLFDGTPGTVNSNCEFVPDPVLVTYCLNGALTMGTETQAGTNPEPGDNTTLDNGIAGTLTSTCEFIANTYCAFGGIVPPDQLNALWDRIGPLSQPGDTITPNGITATFTADCNPQYTDNVCVGQTGGGFTLETNYIAIGAQLIALPDTTTTNLQGTPGTLNTNCEFTPDTDGDGEPDATDNCPNTANPNQANTYGSAAGDACEDTNADGTFDVNESHICISTNGTQHIQQGSADCRSDSGATAIAHDSGAYAQAFGQGATATATDGAFAQAYGQDATATATGNNALASALAQDATATANGTNAEAEATTAGCTATATGPGASDSC